MQRSLWIDAKTWESMKFRAKSLGLNYSNYIRWLHYSHIDTIQSKVPENTGLSLSGNMPSAEDLALIVAGGNDVTLDDASIKEVGTGEDVATGEGFVDEVGEVSAETFDALKDFEGTGRAVLQTGSFLLPPLGGKRPDACDVVEKMESRTAEKVQAETAETLEYGKKGIISPFIDLREKVDVEIGKDAVDEVINDLRGKIGTMVKSFSKGKQLEGHKKKKEGKVWKKK